MDASNDLIITDTHMTDIRSQVGTISFTAPGVLTTESVLFEWCEVAGTDEFRQISRLVTGKDEA